MQGEADPNRTVLSVTGADASHFLQGLVTNDVEKIAQGLVYAAMLTPQGKYLADFLMVSLPDGAIGLDVDAGLAPTLAQRLNMYKLRADVQIADSGLFVHRGTDATPSGALPDPRHPMLGWRLYYDQPGNAPVIDWTAIRVAHMIPETGIELVPNETFILETNFEAISGVDFRKGCYVGQEVTARMKHKTELRKGLAQVDIVDGAAETGDPILSGEKAAGTLLSQSGGRGLAYLRFDRATGPMQAGKATVLRRV
jgi:folate-binding protein YgfZ